MKTPFVIQSDGKDKEVIFSYSSARMAIIFTLTVINGILPVVMLFSSASGLPLGARVAFVFALLGFELLFFLVYFPLQVTMSIDRKASRIRLVTTGPFYLRSRRDIEYSKTPFLRGEQDGDGIYPYFKYVENRQQKTIDLFPYADNSFIGSLSLFRKTLSKDEFELLGKELGVKAIPA